MILVSNHVITVEVVTITRIVRAGELENYVELDVDALITVLECSLDVHVLRRVIKNAFVYKQSRSVQSFVQRTVH